MTIEIKHPFVSAKGDGGDATLVRPSNWNANHSTSMATSRLLGRLTAGAGPFEEIPISALLAGALDETSGAAFLAALGIGGFETGDIKYTFKSTASAGWVLLLGGVGTPPSTIGNAASGGALRANADCQALFIEVYTTCSDTDAPVSGGRTGNALNDFNANKTIRIPNPVGRSPIGAGAACDAPPGGGAASTVKVVGRGYGAETHVLVLNEIPSHFHGAGISDPGHSHGHNAITGSSTTGGGGFPCGSNAGATINAASTGVRVTSPNGLDTTYSVGGGLAHNNMPNLIALNVMVKL